MSGLPDLRVGQIAGTRRRLVDAGYEIHAADTPYGRMEWTEEKDGYGEVWCADVVRINNRDHVLIGSYTKTREWGGNDEGLWRPDPQKPFVSVYGYPGFARLERINGLGPTDSARMKLGRALGAVMGGWPERG